MKPTVHFFLASKSPRRRELLEQIGVAYELLDVDIVEVPGPTEEPLDYVRRVAREKAGAGLMQVAGIAGAVVLGADTEVILAGRIFGKPADAEAAREMLHALSGRVHQVISAVAVVDQGREEERVSISDVAIAKLSAAQIDAYVTGGQCMGKAGAYAIQGSAACFIERIEGSHSGIMGLPLFETAAMLRRFGVLKP